MCRGGEANRTSEEKSSISGHPACRLQSGRGHRARCHTKPTSDTGVPDKKLAALLVLEGGGDKWSTFAKPGPPSLSDYVEISALPPVPPVWGGAGE